MLDLDQLHQTFVATGEHAAAFFRAMSLGTPRVWAPHARQILMLRERYWYIAVSAPDERLNACS